MAAVKIRQQEKWLVLNATIGLSIIMWLSQDPEGLKPFDNGSRAIVKASSSYRKRNLSHLWLPVVRQVAL